MTALWRSCSLWAN